MSEKETSTFTSWVSRPVFLSSTFKDMQAERDHLNQVVFPELAERLRARHVLLEPIDLRQGVETADAKDEEARELLTLKVCLDEIDKSRPLLIVLLGDRYGWTPPKQRLVAAANEKGFQFEVEGKSVTALEIEYGLLKKDKWLQTNCLFLLREPLPYEKMPNNTAEAYSEEYSKELDATKKAKNLQALKQKIMDDPILGKQVRPYTLKWDENTNHVTGLEEWGNWVKEEIWNILDKETKDIEQNLPKTWEEEEKQAIEDFVQDRSKNFVGRDDILSELKEFAHSESKEGADWGACIIAGPGTGKSALFAMLFREFEHDESIFLLSHAAGITPKSGDVDSLLLRWISELSSYLGINNPLPEKYTEEDLDSTFASLLSRSSVNKRVVLLIDALNQFNPTTRGLHMTWLKKTLPINIRFISTSIACDASEALEKREGVEASQLVGLTEENAEKIISAIYKQYHRDVNPGAKSELLKKTDTNKQQSYTNPLWLNLAVEQLNLLDENDFSLAQTSGFNPSEHLAQEMPGDTSALYEWILKRLEKNFGSSWVASIVALVAFSRQGWREMDFEAMLPNVADLLLSNQEVIEWDPLKFAVIRRGLRGQLIQSGSYGRWRFMHQQMQEAVINHIPKVLNLSQSDNDLNKHLHSLICDHLLNLPSDDPIHVSETMWHLIEADDKKRAALYIGNLYESESQYSKYSDFLSNANKIVANEFQNRYDFQEDKISALNVVVENLKSQVVEIRKIKIAWICSLLQQEPNNLPLSFGLSLFMYDLNIHLILLGDLKTRLTLFNETTARLSRLVESEPKNTLWQRQLSVFYERIGEISRSLGKLMEAQLAYQKAMTIIEMLVENDPYNIYSQNDLSTIQLIIGDLNREQNNLAEASKFYKASIVNCLLSIERNPENVSFQSQLACCYEKQGLIHLIQCNYSEAHESYQRCKQIREKLSASDLTNTRLLWELAISYEDIGCVFQYQANFDDAELMFLEGIDILQKLVNSNPDNRQFNNSLSDFFVRQGWVSFEKNNFPLAENMALDAIKIREGLAESDSENALWQRDLWQSYYLLSVVYSNMQDIQCIDGFKKVITIMNNMQNKGMFVSQGDLADYNKIKDFLKECEIEA